MSKKNKPKARTISASILAAQERNKLEFEAQLVKSKREFQLLLLLTMLSAIMPAWYHGSRGGAIEGNCAYVSLDVPERKKKNIIAYTEKLYPMYKALYARLLENITQSRMNEIEKSFIRCIQFIDNLIKQNCPPELFTPFNDIALQTAVLTAHLADWTIIQDANNFEIEDDVFAFIKLLAEFSEKTIWLSEYKLRVVATVTYWTTVNDIMGYSKFLDDHPNNLPSVNKRIAIIRFSEVTPEEAKKEYLITNEKSTLSYNLYLDDSLIIPFHNYSETNEKICKQHSITSQKFIQEHFPDFPMEPIRQSIIRTQRSL